MPAVRVKDVPSTSKSGSGLTTVTVSEATYTLTPSPSLVSTSQIQVSFSTNHRPSMVSPGQRVCWVAPSQTEPSLYQVKV